MTAIKVFRAAGALVIGAATLSSYEAMAVTPVPVVVKHCVTIFGYCVWGTEDTVITYSWSPEQIAAAHGKAIKLKLDLKPGKKGKKSDSFDFESYSSGVVWSDYYDPTGFFSVSVDGDSLILDPGPNGITSEGNFGALKFAAILPTFETGGTFETTVFGSDGSISEIVDFYQSCVPDTDSWSLMIMGFSVVGLVSRRNRKLKWELK